MSTKGGRVVGAVNYKKSLVFDVVSSILPAGMEAWRIVASRYWTLPDETVIRDPADMKRFFMSKCVNLTKKPKGESAPAQLTRRANEVYKNILCKENAQSYRAAEDASEEEEEGYDCVDEEGDFEATNTPTIMGGSQDASSAAVVQFSTPAYEGVRKRKTPLTESDNKSKNCRNVNPRTSAASAINNLVNQIGNNSSNNQMMQIMQMMVQQQSAAAAAQQQQNMLMMLLMNRTPPAASSAFVPSSASSFATGTTDSTGDVSMTSSEIAHHFD